MLAHHKGEIPVVILFFPFLAGIVAAINLPVVDVSILTVLLFGFAAVFIVLNLLYKKLNIHKQRWAGGLLINVVLLLFGWVITVNYNELNSPNHFSKTIAQYVMVRINNEPVSKNGWIRFTATAEQNINQNKSSSTSGNLLISIKDSLAKSLYYGDELLIPANYTPVDPPFNPAEFNYKQYLAYQNIHYQSFLYQGQYAVLSRDAGNPFIAFSLRLRQQLVAKLKTNMHDADAIAVASAMLLGYRTDLSPDVLQAYSQTGTVYVLTVSGAQVAIIYFLLSYLLVFLSRFRYGRAFRAVIIIAIISYYALLTGFSPAVCRAAVMASMIVAGKAFNRYINTLNLLAVSAFVLLIADPYLISTVGLQFSFIAISGLIIFRPVVYNWFKFKNRWADKLWALCSVSIAAQVILFPLSAFYFHQFPVYFLVSNVLVFIPAAIVMYAGIAYLLLPQIPFVSAGLGYMLEKIIVSMNKALSFIEHAPFATINKIWINPLEYLLLYAIIISLFCFFYYRKWWLMRLGLYSMLLLSVCISYKKIKAMRTDSIAFLNLRKHVGLVMKHGTSAVVISNLRDTDKNYKYSIQPYLDSCGIGCISRFDADQDINTPFLIKKYGLIQFLDKRVMIFDDSTSNALLHQKINTDYLYLTGNPKTDLQAININFTYKTLIIAAANSDHYINALQQQAKTFGINYNTLKRNKALIIVSN
jgi:competence protein ComEC